jgi:hypothetical protein
MEYPKMVMLKMAWALPNIYVRIVVAHPRHNDSEFKVIERPDEKIPQHEFDPSPPLHTGFEHLGIARDRHPLAVWWHLPQSGDLPVACH